MGLHNGRLGPPGRAGLRGRLGGWAAGSTRAAGRLGPPGCVGWGWQPEQTNQEGRPAPQLQRQGRKGAP
eukprot:364428-Chlamydomonas_euryale.AAC.4